VFLKIDPEAALERVRSRGDSSRFEQLDFLREVGDNYLRLAKLDPTIVQVDADRPSEVITEEVLRLISERKL
jgi:thymidylate kinase